MRLQNPIVLQKIAIYAKTRTDYLTTIAGPWYFWQGIRTSKAHKPVTLSGNATFTKV